MRRWRRWAVAVVGWTLFAVLAATVFHVRGLQGEASPWLSRLGWQLAAWWPWAVLTPPILALARRRPVDRGTWRFALPIHVGAGLMITALYVTVYLVIAMWASPMPDTLDHFLEMVAGSVRLEFPLYLLVFAAIDGVGHAIEYQERYRERELRATALEGQLARARLDALRSQVHPHFLFNALHAIGGLVRRDRKDEAVRAIASLSELLRASLESGDEDEIPLWREIVILDRFAEIQRARYGDRFRLERELDEETLEARVPPLVLQPVIENAVRHGLDRRRDAGAIRVTATRAGNRLRLGVWNEAAEDEGETAGMGIGLANTRDRLRALYGDDQTLEITRSNGGTLVRIELPWRTGP